MTELQILREFYEAVDQAGADAWHVGDIDSAFARMVDEAFDVCSERLRNGGEYHEVRKNRNL